MEFSILPCSTTTPWRIRHGSLGLTAEGVPGFGGVTSLFGVLDGRAVGARIRRARTAHPGECGRPGAQLESQAPLLARRRARMSTSGAPQSLKPASALGCRYDHRREPQPRPRWRPDLHGGGCGRRNVWPAGRMGCPQRPHLLNGGFAAMHRPCRGCEPNRVPDTAYNSG